ncbi:MAG: copper resistance system multicopper oxidase [Gammaproteobacteria bacterium]
MPRSNPSAASFAERRRFVMRALAGAGALGVDSLLPAWARGAVVAGASRTGSAGALEFDLAIREQRLDIAGGLGRVMTINETVPGPLLEWQEGREVVLNVTNHLHEATSIHWHGILLPFEMDGVPGVAFRGIGPGETFQYRFPVVQSGTYWYHSHSGLQEQAGVYGPLIVHPREPDPVACERDYVIMLSDWTFEDPHRVLAKLKKMSDYYNFQQFTATTLFATGEMSAKAAWRKKLAWDRMRMMPTDIADVTGATYSYLMNGLHPAGNWTGLFTPGERVRLRFINGSAMSYFNVRIPGLAMTVVAADGQAVEPVETDEFQIGVAETYDVVVEPRGEAAYTVMAESMDRSGYAAGTLATRPGLSAPVPPLRTRPLLDMVDMGMDMDMTDSHGGAMSGGSGSGHDAHAGHAGMAAAGVGAVVARHDKDHHGPGNISVAQVQRDRLGERGTGLANAAHRVLVYRDLVRRDDDFDDREPGREIELHLTGHMERYMWSFDGKQFHEVDGPIEFYYGERLRLILVNDTMMNHPIHLHGMWMELENGHGRHIPRKHTINIMPAARVSALITADAPGRWAFHCHLLYHMHMGMFRVVRVNRRPTA